MTISDVDWQRVLDSRVRHPELVADAYARRRRRARPVGPRGTLFLVAADHPARGSLAVGDDPLAMSDRRRLVERLILALAEPEVDGILGSPDIVEDLLLLGALDDKVVIGSMNRGGLDGAVWTMDDRFTAYDAAAIASYRLDGGKMLLRLDDDDAATARTLASCAAAVGELADRGLMAMVEPLPYGRDEMGRPRLSTDTPALVRAVAIGSALGHTSARTWLKLPACSNPEVVFAATSLPCVVLGGAPGPDPRADLASWRRALAQPTVRGLVVGRALLYPPGGDVGSAVQAAAKAVRASAGTRP